MSIKKFCQAFLAYVFASITVAILAGVATEVLQPWVEVTFWQLCAGLWLLVVGMPTTTWANQQLARALGVRTTPQLKVARGGWRSIPVAGNLLADATRAVIPGQSVRGTSITVADEVFVRCGEFTFTEADILPVLRRAWSRQRLGKSALGRSYWIDRGPFWGDRRKYRAFADALSATGALVGRTDRRSGRMVKPPLSTIYDLRHMATG